MTRRSTLILLALLVLISAMGTVWVRYQNRLAYHELDRIQERRDELNLIWSQLMLEEGTLSVHGLIERAAREELQMRMPDPQQIRFVTAGPS